MKKSKLGYKRYSPDVRKPYNVIPSGRITMQDVDFPVYGIDDMGNAQMMYPGGEYQFPGNQVFELPIAQVGGQRDTIYTPNPNDPRLKAYQDSLYVRALNSQTFRPGNRTRPLTLDEKIFWKDEKTGLVPNLVEYNPAKPTWGYFGHYKKPVQPVEYREVSKVIVKPKELLGDTNSSKLEVKRTPRLPESIDSIKQDASGVNVYVTVNGKTSVIPKKDYPLWRAENKDLYDAYTVKRAYGGEQLLMAQIGRNLPKPYIRSDFFTPRQIEEARYNQARKFATPASGRIEGEGLIDVVLPVVAAPIVKAIAKPLMKIMGDAASYTTTQTPLRNAWRLNPKAYQYNLPENTMWRGIGQEGMDDAVSSGVFRSKQDVPVEYFPGSTFRASKTFGTNPYFTPKFKTAADYGDNFIAEVPIGAANWRNRYTNKPWSQIADKQIPIDEGKILQKDWLQGYKEIPKQLPGSPNAASSVDDVFNSKLEGLINRESPLLTRNFNAAEFTDDMRGLRMENRMLDNDFYQARNTKHFSGSGAGAAIGGGDYNTTFVGNIDDLRKNAHLRDVSPTDTYFYNPGDKFSLPDEGVFITSDPKVYKKLSNAGKTVKLDANLFSDAGNANLEKYITKDRGDVLKSFDNYLANPDNRGSLIPSLYPNKKEAFASSWNSSAAHSYDILNTLESPASLLSNFRDPIIKEQWAKLPASAQQFELKKLNDYYKNNVLTGKISKDNLLNYDLKTYQNQYKKILEDLAEQSREYPLKKGQWGTEFKVDNWLGRPMEKAEAMADKYTKPGNDQPDNLRHPLAARYASEAIQKKTGNIPVVSNLLGFVGGSALGLAHELLDPNKGSDERPYTFGETVREGAEDQFNNIVGALVGSLPFMSGAKKTQALKYLSDNNMLPDGYGRDSDNMYFKEYGGDLEEFGSGGLKQWFAEKWVDVKTGKECGRSGKDKDGRPYPACRPSKRINSTTPKTTSEMSSSEKARFKREKTSGQRISYNHKRRQQGGQISGSLGYDSMYNSPVASFRYMMNPKDESKYYGEVYGTKQGPGIAAGLDYDDQKYGTQGMVRLGADPLRGASIRAQAGKRFNPIDNRKEDLSWGPYGGVNFQTNDYTEFTGTGNELDYNNLRPRLTAGANAEYNRELANRGRFSIEGDLGVGVGSRYGSVGEFRPEPYGAVKATYSPPMYKNTRNKRPSPTTYSPRGYQLGGQMTPQGLTPAFFTGMKDAAVDAFKTFMSSSDRPIESTQSTVKDWRKMDRPKQIDYGINEVVMLEPEDKRKDLENLLESTAYMENRYGEDSRAYGRDYTSSFMSIDPIALKDMFTGRGDKGRYNNSQRAQFENFKKLGLPVTQNEFNSKLREDDPVAAMAATRFRYAMAPKALPDMNDSKAMFDYWLKYYNGNGVTKYQSREQAYKDFLKGYKLALAND